MQKIRFSVILILVIISSLSYLTIINLKTNADTLNLNASEKDFVYEVDSVTILISGIFDVGTASLPNEMTVVSYSFGGIDLSKNTDPEQRASQIQMSDFFVLKLVDKGSTQIFEKFIKKALIETVQITEWFNGRNGPFNRFVYILSDVTITSYFITHEGIQQTTESISFSFNQIIQRMNRIDENNVITVAEEICYNNVIGSFCS